MASRISMNQTHSFPPTPAPSTEIIGCEGAKHQDFPKLPSPAIGSLECSTSSSDSDSSYHPESQSEPSRKRPRKSIDDDAYTPLPPPPSRPRKIIQMRPDGTQQGGRSPTKVKGRGPGGGRRQGNGTSVANKKAARKTAHSVIERRRRSRMNEEYGVLKEMVPACKGQEMHKLAILQAAIEYMRYLERCVTDLKSGGRYGVIPTPLRQDELLDDDDEQDIDESNRDDDIKDTFSSQQPSPALTADVYNTSALVSPILTTSASRDHRASHSVAPSLLSSPAIETPGQTPCDPPDTEAHEATAALLMLNTDRRHLGSSTSRTREGISVQELLST